MDTKTFLCLLSSITLASSVYTMDTSPATTLLEAVKEDNLYTVIDILKSNPPLSTINETDKEGRTPLYFAARNMNPTLVKLLLESGAFADSREMTNKSPLYWAATYGKPQIINLLIKHGANPNQTFSNGTTALFCAATNGHFEAVKTLIACGAEAGHKNEDGLTAAYWATENGHHEIARLLDAQLHAPNN